VDASALPILLVGCGGVPTKSGGWIQPTWGVPARVFGGGKHACGCCYCHWCCCLATTGVGATTTLLLSLSMAHAIFLCARIVSERQQQQVPTWPLLGCCLYLLFSSFLLLSSPFPTPHPFLSISLLWARIEQVGNPVFGLTQGRWWWWVGWTNRHQAAMQRWRCDTR
jgi:hypothetical protein